MLASKWSFSVLILVAVVNSALSLSCPLVKVDSGYIIGRTAKTVGTKETFYAYQGIPYAEPPVGALRFKPPQTKSKWGGILETTKDGANCLQTNGVVEGSEDCLFMNVYTPVTPGSFARIPVMVFIHGGGFQGGDSTYDLYGPDYFLEQDVIVVSFNYRLGIMGFCSTGDLTVPGNNGLKDQVHALKWIKSNIAKFGGNPNDVTIFGQSAGSASVSYHLQSPLSKGLFHKAIMQSGVTLSSWAFSRHTPAVIAATASALGVDTSSTAAMIEGLRQVDATTLQLAAGEAGTQSYMLHNPTEGFAIGPVIEPQHSGAFWTKYAHNGLQNGEVVSVPTIVGYNSLEGTFAMDAIRAILVIFDYYPGKLTPVGMNVTDDALKTQAGLLIKQKYFGDIPISSTESDRNAMIFLSDHLFNRPTREYVRLLHKKAPVFFYKFSYEGGLWGYANRTEPGVTHSEELGYLFRSKYEASAQDVLTRQRMIAMWTNFAKHGNPTPPTKQTVLKDIHWERSDQSFTYMDIGHNVVKSTLPQKDIMQFWDDLFDTYGVQPFDTY